MGKDISEKVEVLPEKPSREQKPYAEYDGIELLGEGLFKGGTSIKYWM